MKIQDRKYQLELRRQRVRKTVKGATERPRLSVYKSSKHIYAQIIDDFAGRTLAAASTLTEEFKGKKVKSSTLEAAKIVGNLLAEKAQQAGLKKVVFDRGGNKYHGRIKTLAEGAREKGLEF